MGTNNMQDYEVKAGFETLDGFSVVGLSIVTDNDSGAESINKVWEDFFQQQVGQALEEYKDNDFIYAVYSDYEGDHTQPYRFTLGYKLKEDAPDALPEGLHRVETETADYAMLSAAGEQPKALIEAWTAIWQSDLERRYTSDFEIYGPRFFEDGVNEILLCIGVNNTEGQPS